MYRVLRRRVCGVNQEYIVRPAAGAALLILYVVVAVCLVVVDFLLRGDLEVVAVSVAVDIPVQREELQAVVVVAVLAGFAGLVLEGVYVVAALG